MLTKNHIKWLNNNSIKSLSATFIFVFLAELEKITTIKIRINATKRKVQML